jgi:hypothetical protein
LEKSARYTAQSEELHTGFANKSSRIIDLGFEQNHRKISEWMLPSVSRKLHVDYLIRKNLGFHKKRKRNCDGQSQESP